MPHNELWWAGSCHTFPTIYASFKNKLSGIKQKLFYYAPRFHGSGTCSCHSEEGLPLSWELGSSGHFFTHVSGHWAGMTTKLNSVGIVNWSMYIWPLHVVWVSCSVAVGLQEGEFENASSERARWTWCWRSQGLNSIALYWLKKSQVQF